MRVSYHRVSGYNDPTGARKLERLLVLAPKTLLTYLLFLVGSKNGNLTICDIRPLHKLRFPLHDRHAKLNVKSSLMRKILTAYEEVHRTRQLFLTVHAAVMPTSVLPAPQGSTMIPERARLVIGKGNSIVNQKRWHRATYPFPNILLRLFS